MFNPFNHKPADPYTTYLDVDTGEVKTVPNAQYTRKKWTVETELTPYSEIITKPDIIAGKLRFEHVRPQKGIQVNGRLNLEVLLANLTLFRDFINTDVTKLLDDYANLQRELALAKIELAKPPEPTQEEELREAGAKLYNHCQELQAQNDELANTQQQLIEKLAEYEAMVGDVWKDIKTMISLFQERNINVRYLENYSEADTHTFRFQNVGRQIDDAKLKRVCETLPATLNWVTNPPSYEVSMGEIVLEFDTRDLEAQIDSMQREWLPDLAECESNLIIFGAKGTGKTSLVNNYVNITLNKIPNAQVEYLQPKPEETTPQSIPDGCMSLGFEKCFERHQWLMDEYMRRNELNTEAIRDGKPLPKFAPIFAIYEEFQTMVVKAPEYGLTPKKLCIDVQTAVSFGRTLGLNFLVTAQVASVTNYPGWTKISITQYNRLYLGEAIKVGEDYAQSTIDKKEIRDQYCLYRKSQRRFYGLLVTPNDGNHIYDLPPAGTYTLLQDPQSSHNPMFTVKCNRRDYLFNQGVNREVLEDSQVTVKDDVLTCDCGHDKWIPHKYLGDPGSKIHLRCASCKAKVSLVL